MHFKLLCLYKDGILIDKDQLAKTAAHVGNLVIEDWLEGSALKRPVRQKRLLIEMHLITSDIIPPLFEPTVIRMTTNEMKLQGHEISTRDGVATHYIQAWAVRMTSRTE